MSKQRPSQWPRPAARTHPASFWRRRVFKNTYTREHKLHTVKGWSVKIQHHGVRRTFSLGSARRVEAAVEAQAIYQTILTEGWEAALPADSSRTVRRVLTLPAAPNESLPKTEVGYWKLRLLRRKYPGPSGAGSTDQLSARIEHDGISHYFPLGTSDEKAAAAKALEIYQTIAGAGWEEARRRFPRELTLAFHWAANPLAWSYATIHTQPTARPASTFAGSATGPKPGSEGPAPRRGESPLLTIAIVESERGLHQAIAWHLRHQVSSACYFASGEEAIREVPRQRIQLALVNHTLADMGGAICAEKLSRLAPSLPVLIYSVQADSEDLFKATPGGVAGYVLKRTAPEHLLAPIEGLLAAATISHEQISEKVRQYFQAVTSSLQSGQHMNEMGLLTSREREVLDYLSKGYIDKEIAEALGISAWTVHGHIKSIFEKFDVHSRTAAVVKYLQK